MSNLSETLRKSILILFQTMLILVPFVWTTSTSELFEFPKMLLVYFFTIIITSFWLVRMVLEKRFIWSKTFLDIPLLLFLLSQILATLFSMDRHTSLYGYYSRFHGGLLSTISYLLLYYAAAANLKLLDAKKILTALVISGVIASLYAFPEHFGHSPSCVRVAGQFTANCWVQDVQTRVFGTFGQPNWLAAFLITIMFIPLAQATRKSSILKTSLWLLVTGLFFAVLLFTKSRSGLAGLALGMLIFWPLTFFTLRHNFKRVLILFLSFILISSACFLVFGKGAVSQLDTQIAKIFTPRSTIVTPQSVSPDKPLPSGTQLEVGGTESGAIRRIVWSGAINLWKMHPLVGSGVETFAYGYYNARPVEHNLVSEWDFLYNKAHNEFLNFLSTTGLIGLLTYLSVIFTYTLWSLIQIFKKHDADSAQIAPTAGPPGNRLGSRGRKFEPVESLLIIALLSGFWALMVSNFFGFSTVPVGLLFFLYPAIAFLLARANHDSPLPHNPIKTSQYVLLAILLMTSSFFLLKLVNYYRADLAYAKGKAYNEAGDLTQALPLLQKAFSLWDNEPTYSDELALANAKAALSLASSNKLEDARLYAQQGVALSNLTLKHNQVHLNFWKTRARIFLALATLDGQYIAPGEQALIQAGILAPTDAKIFYNLGSLNHQLNNFEEAKKYYQKTLELKPDYAAAQSGLDDIIAFEATQSANP